METPNTPKDIHANRLVMRTSRSPSASFNLADSKVLSLGIASFAVDSPMIRTTALAKSSLAPAALRSFTAFCASNAIVAKILVSLWL